MELFLASLVSGLVGVGVSTHYYLKHEKRKVKLDSLREFVGNRYDVRGAAFSKALNEIYVVFNDSSIVMDALNSYHETVVNLNNSEDKLVILFKAMCSDLNLEMKIFNDSFFLNPFNVKK